MRAGLEALAGSAPDLVLIHDAARPFLTSASDRRAPSPPASEHGAAVPAIAIADTVKKIDDQAMVTETLERSRLRMVQTPQAFAFGLIVDAHRRAAAAGREDFSDDAALAEWAGHRVNVFAGETANVKLTTDDDFARAEVVRTAALADVRTGKRFRRARLRRRRSCHARRRAHPACARADRTFRRRRRAARAGRRHPRRACRRRHRRALSAERSAMARRRVRPLSRLRLRARARARRRDRASRRDHRLRGAARRPAPRRHARAHRGDRRHSRDPRRGQGDDQRESSASPAAAKASSRWRQRRCGCRGAQRDRATICARRPSVVLDAVPPRAACTSRPRNPAPAAWSPRR